MVMEERIKSVLDTVRDATLEGWGAVVLFGVRESAGRRDSSSSELILYLKGPHAGHVAQVTTRRFYCGAFFIDIHCSCGSSYQNDVQGCSFWGHRREGGGDSTLVEGLP